MQFILRYYACMMMMNIPAKFHRLSFGASGKKDGMGIGGLGQLPSAMEPP